MIDILIDHHSNMNVIGTACGISYIRSMGLNWHGSSSAIDPFEHHMGVSARADVE